MNSYFESSFSYMHEKNSVTQLMTILEADTLNSIRISALHESTLETLKFIDNLRKQLISYTGGVDENGNYINPKSAEPVREFMITQQNASELKTKIEAYSNLLSEYGLANSQIIVDPTTDPWLSNDPKMKGSTFGSIHFGNSNLVEAITAFDIYSTRIRLMESTTINIILAKKPSNI
ncbi:hypothetical protein [Reichenbachiella ulvae]|uniref:Gliding motility-associated protein GldM N-terminal domain-containing protein n=1 Tax=Reichenbachiella ulvae TaxID=2980104 RepID=A0ABT3CTF4_9BACT|nr:hypothetical protein [Reichenbachiella ulvae]MCV9386990.1 hypothetical protein [Reichenbachiella ulvae]